jgi:hypothetical protein
LLVADTGLDASKAAGGRALFAATALGAVLTGAAGGLVGMLGPPPRTRATVMGIAVLAAFVAPALFTRTHRGDAFQDPCLRSVRACPRSSSRCCSP